ncbi:Hypothetical protein R9X50_00008000 [Acrodontium crateriforme]|uniref:Uncharacterized protein n=1 Tax=Acrodontium crateriforme TaxID=150365 RepID=A0AAQ3LXD8_9PEZI|nr:Hypothetical protein R9X50_00008000 [Acrodontium crateriforme]
MPPIPQKPQTEDSTTFSPDVFFDRWAREDLTPPWNNDFRMFVLKAFGLPLDDDYEYVAVAQVTLLQAQTYVEFGGQGGLHAWYRDENGEVLPSPSAADIAAYTNIFRPTTSTSKALTALASNAKKDSIRLSIATHLQTLYKPAPPTSPLTVTKTKIHVNPAFDVWTWTCQNLEWAGPEPSTAKVRISHAILPIMYHHFGCVCPSYESLAVIRQAAAGRRVIDMGSGNGYWTYMLRRLEASSPAPKKCAKRMEVVPVDNGISEWRTMWVGDTVQAEGDVWLKKQAGGKEDVLLLIYPSVGNDFTGRMIKAYRGTTIISAGSQNTNGYTGFAKETLPQWMAREMPGWDQVLQLPLPSFAGKDEALFVFEKKAADL